MKKSLAINNNEDIILNGNLWKTVWKLSWPAVLGMLLYSLNTIIDMIFVGRFIGEKALSGVTIAYPLIQIPSGIGSLIGVGAGAILSIAIGKKDIETQEKIVPVTNYLNLVFSIIYTIIGIILLEPALKLMGAQGENFKYAYDYFSVCIYGGVFFISGLSYNMIVRAEGKMKTAMFMMSTGLIANIIFNYIFVSIFKLGVKGIGWGTNIGMLIYTLVFFIYVYLKKISFKSNYKSIKIDKNIIKKVISLGFPSSIMSFMTLIQGIVIIKILTSIGNDFDVAFYGVSYRYLSFFIIPLGGFMRASQPFFGQCYGARLYKRIIKGYKQFTLAAILLVMPFWIIALFTPKIMISLMMPNIILSSVDLFNFRIMIAILPLIPVLFIALSLFPAVENPKPAAIIGIARQFVFYIPAMIVLPKLFGISWIYKASFLIDISILAITLFIVKAELKKLSLL